MNPLLIIASQLIPDFVRIFAGDRTGSAAEKVVDAVKEVTKTDDPEEARRRLQDDAQARVELQKVLAEIAFEETKEQNRAEAEQRRIELDFMREELAEAERVRQAEFERLKLDLEDINKARANYAEAMQRGGPSAWVVPIIAIITTLSLFYFLYHIMVFREPIENKDVFNIVLGALTTAFITVITFFFGSSHGSRDKDRLISSGTFVPAPGVDLGSAAAGRSSGTISDRLGPRPQPDAIRPSPQPPMPHRPPATGTFGLFRQKAPGVMRQLIQDFGLTKEQAAGVLGNIGHECAGFRLLQEQKPLRGGRGGWGWCQWTGERRREFEAWASERGMDFASDEANYGFLRRELSGVEGSKVLPPLRRATSIDEATSVFMTVFERPSPAHAGLDSRRRWARLALSEYQGAYHA